MDVRRELRERFGPDCERSREPLERRGVLGRCDDGDLVYDPYNRRLKLLRISAEDLHRPEVRLWRDGLGADGSYSKLIAYGLPGGEGVWEGLGFAREGILTGFFADGTDAWIWSAFAAGDRALTPRDAEHDATVALARSKAVGVPARPDGFSSRRAEVADASALSALLGEVFADYPTPTDEAAVRSRIETGSNVFRMMFDRDGRLAAAASAEVDHRRRSAELTDCATLPAHRGAGLMGCLLHELEREMVDGHGITDLYTIARADEVGMNCVFAKLGWAYTGRLRNNCRMPSGWESMNLWCRPQTAEPGHEEGR